MLPASVTRPVSGLTVPVNALFATGVIVTVAGTGFVIATSNGVNVMFASGILMFPDASTVPVIVPVNGLNAPSPVVSVPLWTVMVTAPGLLTAAPAAIA